MKRTDQTLLEQMQITEFEISSRKELFLITPADELALKEIKPLIERKLAGMVEQFYEMQTAVPEIALLIGDADTLSRLKSAQHRYVTDLFSGYYDIEYVNNRLRIGLVHKRIGVEPKLYLAAIMTLRTLLYDLVDDAVQDEQQKLRVIPALQKMIMFDITLVFDTYIRGLVSEIETSKHKLESYAQALEERVKERTTQLETLSRTDALTGLLNMRHLQETLVRTLRAAQRRMEPVTLAYVDVNDFKLINDTQGHQRGDEILKSVASAIKAASRLEDLCFRYGGDEFCVIMTNCTIANARLWQERTAQLLQQHDEESPTLSIGFAQTGPESYVSAEELIRMADAAMYVVKKSSKAPLEEQRHT